MVLQNVLHQGYAKIKNLKGLQPFIIEYQSIQDCVQLDISGVGALNYYGPVTNNLKKTIKKSIDEALQDYESVTGHDTAEIGYYFNLRETKIHNKRYNIYEAEISLYIFYKRPAGKFRLVMEAITSNILGEIFILRN